VPGVYVEPCGMHLDQSLMLFHPSKWGSWEQTKVMDAVAGATSFLSNLPTDIEKSQYDITCDDRTIEQ
jgi:hypothetical protein